ncbi:MAG: triphosphoribosyl-dephospho-CoA synthase, partial [Paraburkholderia sp.]|uniref:triphosphoribosyl-dephospho-CoA synthase n=1 Tax=Paraburkholderia sp. TaxID=1926495 RepID=UPI003C591409
MAAPVSTAASASALVSIRSWCSSTYSGPGIESGVAGAWSDACLARLAVTALIEEVQLTPKPALVDRRGSGAHRDLDLDIMLRSAHSLEP